jgi:ribonuclease HI
MPDEDHSRDASIELYADGSFCHEATYGAWAFRVPALNLEGVGSSEGRTVTRFELLGVLKGLKAMTSAGRWEMPIEVISGCDSTVNLIKLLCEGRPLRKPEQYRDMGDLVPRLQAILEDRQIHARRYAGGSLHHQECHRNAHRRLREEIGSKPGMFYYCRSAITT